MSFDLGQALGGAVKQWNEMTDQEMVNRKLKIEEAKAKREADEALRQDEKRSKISAFAEIQNQPVAGYASSTSIEQLKKQYPDQPFQQDGQLTQFGTALMNSIQNGTGVGFKPTDKALIEEMGAYGKAMSAQQGIQDPSRPPPANPFENISISGSRITNKNFNPDAAPSADDQKMYINDYKKALVNIYKFSDNPEDIIKVDKMMRDKKFEENANNFLDAKRAMALGDDNGALKPINNLMSSIMPGVQVGGLIRDKSGQLSGVTDISGKPIQVDMKELQNLFASNNLMQINEFALKNREVGAKEVAAQGEAMKGQAYMMDANTKASEAPSRIANNIANTDSLIDKRKADADSRESINFEKQKVFAMGIKDPSAMTKSEKERYGMLSPVADTLWQTSRDTGLKITGSQAVDLAEGITGRIDKKTKTIDPSTIRYGAFIDSKTPDGLVSIKDLKNGQVKGYMPRPAGQDQAPQASAESAPTPGIKSPTQSVDNQKYIRTKNNKGGYDYIPSPRGLTKAQYAESDAQKTK